MKSAVTACEMTQEEADVYVKRLRGGDRYKGLPAQLSQVPIGR